MYAGQAEVVYTIGPVDKDGSSPLRSINNSAVYVAPEEEQSILSNIALPSLPQFKFDANVNTLQDWEEIRQAKGLPGMRIVLNQTEGYYQLVYDTQENFKPAASTHQVNIPLVGELKVGRRFNDKMEVLETSAYNILIDKNLPAVNVVYFNQEDRYEGSLSASARSANVKVKANVPRNKDKARSDRNTENYQVEYNYKF
jgi:hypothetical protein